VWPPRALPIAAPLPPTGEQPLLLPVPEWQATAPQPERSDVVHPGGSSRRVAVAQ
jgi:hypothetical protein